MFRSTLLSVLGAIQFFFGYRRRFAAQPGFMQKYEDENHELFVYRARAIATVGVFLVPACGLLDYALALDELPIFLSIRFFYSFCSIIFVTSLSRLGASWVQPLVLLLALQAEAGIYLMAALLGGWESLYFAGAMPVTIAITMFLPWRPIVCASYCLTAILSYVLINSYFHPWEIEMLTPIVFLLCNALTATLATMGLEASRMNALAAKLVIKGQIEGAKAIQQALLPPMKQSLGGLDIEALYIPSEELSGDFFDSKAVGEWTYVYLADVTGHGIAAAQVTYIIKEIFSQALSHEMELVSLFDVVRSRYLDHQLEYSVGLQIVRVKASTGEAEYLRTNSPDPVLLNGGAKPTFFHVPTSPLISLLAGHSTEPAKVEKFQINTDDWLYLYSDGVYEFTIESGAEFGSRRFSRALAKYNTSPWPESLVEHLREQNIDDAFSDDLTIVRLHLTS